MPLLEATVTILFIAVLVAREFIALNPDPQARRLARILAVAAVPLVCAFAVIFFGRVIY